MTINELCKMINLQEEVVKRVQDFSENFDFSEVDEIIKRFHVYEEQNNARIELQELLGEDEDNIKILSCMIKGAADTYDFYMEKGIPTKIYIDTFSCFTRFIDECYKMTGKYSFDREWWTSRQVGGHIFRIGALEYEFKPVDGVYIVSMHIPSGADLSPESVRKSIDDSKEFIESYFPQFSNCEYRCHSWILSSVLKELLPETSNLIRFQKMFSITGEYEEGFEFLEWIYSTKDRDFSKLAENTTLQRKLKEYLLAGGILKNGVGIYSR